MTCFCTRCGAANLDAARFCEACGTPIKAVMMPAAQATVSATGTPRRPNRRALVAIATAGIAVIVIGGGLAYWLAPEAASEASFKRAIDRYLIANPDVVTARVCLNNMRYQQDTLRIAEYDRSKRKWMDALARSGLYTPAKTERSGSYFVQTQYAYSLTDDGRQAIRNNKLCLGEGLQIKSVSGFDAVQTMGQESVALARATLVIRDEASWLSKSPARKDILDLANRQNIALNVPVALTDGKWQVDPDAGTRLQKLRRQGRSETSTSIATPDFFATIQQWFTFGGNPLIGKWRDNSGLIHFEFTSHGVIDGNNEIPARYEINGDVIKVIPEENPGSAFVVQLRDKDTAIIDMGLMEIRLNRIK